MSAEEAVTGEHRLDNGDHEDSGNGPRGPVKGKGKGPGKGQGKAPPKPPVNAAPKPKAKPAESPTQPQKTHVLQAFHSCARLQLEDGHWGKEAQCEMAKHVVDPVERENLMVADEYYFTIFMVMCGDLWFQLMNGSETKTEKSVKLGDGRGKADTIEIKISGLSAEETQERKQLCADAAQLRSDWREVAETWLGARPLEEAGEGGRRGAEERANADIAKYFVTDVFQKRAPGRQNLSAEEKQKREQARMEKEMAMRKKEEEQRAIAAARKNHYAALTPADINSVAWGNAVEINVCSGGSGGAALLDLGSSCVVLKVQGKTATNELIAQHLANAMNVAVAQVRVVKYGEDEYGLIKESAKPCRVVGYQRDLTFNTYFGLQINQTTGAVEDWCREVGLFGILEFVAGCQLMGLEGNQALSAANDNMYTSLGKLCSLDVLINNLDRVPLPLWSNEGNMGNVMVAKEGSQIVGIDQQVNLVKAGPGLDQYLQGVRSIVACVFPGGDPKLIIAKLRTCLEENCGAQLSDSNAELVLDGFRIGFETISNKWNSGELKQALESGIADCMDRFTITWDVTGHSTAFPRLDDLELMTQFVCAVASEIASVVGKTQ